MEQFRDKHAGKLPFVEFPDAVLYGYLFGKVHEFFDEEELFTDEEFEKIMEDSAKKREYINKVLYGQYKTYAKAAEYITKLELTYGKFKQLVDWEYYKEGGYPSPTTPAKLWSIFNRFNESIRLVNKYGFTQQDGLCKEFGLNIELVKPVPVKHPWMTDDPTIEDLDEE